MLSHLYHQGPLSMKLVRLLSSTQDCLRSSRHWLLNIQGPLRSRSLRGERDSCQRCPLKSRGLNPGGSTLWLQQQHSLLQVRYSKSRVSISLNSFQLVLLISLLLLVDLLVPEDTRNCSISSIGFPLIFELYRFQRLQECSNYSDSCLYHAPARTHTFIYYLDNFCRTFISVVKQLDYVWNLPTVYKCCCTMDGQMAHTSVVSSHVSRCLDSANMATQLGCTLTQE